MEPKVCTHSHYWGCSSNYQWAREGEGEGTGSALRGAHWILFSSKLALFFTLQDEESEAHMGEGLCQSHTSHLRLSLDQSKVSWFDVALANTPHSHLFSSLLTSWVAMLTMSEHQLLRPFPPPPRVVSICCFFCSPWFLQPPLPDPFCPSQ